MAQGINSAIKETFHLKDVDIKTYSPLALAYIGDGIYDLVIRTMVIDEGNTKAVNLHRTTSQLVKAHAQSAMMEVLKPLLSDEEREIYRRGRNAKSATMAKNATMSDYRRATGFEALMGYLYLTDQFDRILKLCKVAVDSYNVKTGKCRE